MGASIRSGILFSALVALVIVAPLLVLGVADWLLDPNRGGTDLILPLLRM